MISSSVSSSGDDLFISYLPEFQAKTDPSSNPLPRSFCVRSLRDFVGDLPDELLLCPVRALREYLSRTSSLSLRLRSVFVSPHSTSRSLSKNALSFFIHDLISQASSSFSLLVLGLLPLLRGLCNLCPLTVHIVFAGLRRLWLLLAILLFPPFWRQPLGVLRQCLLHFTLVMSNSLLIRVSVLVRLWLQVPWYDVFVCVGSIRVFVFNMFSFFNWFRFPSLSAGSECFFFGGGGGGGGGSSHSSPHHLFLSS